MRRALAVVALVMGVGIRAAGAWSGFTNGAFPASSDTALAIAVDGNGDPVAAGITEGEAGDVFTVVKHQATDGDVRWKRLVAGTGDGSGRAVAVEVDGSNAVIAAGWLDGFNTSGDLAVVKWDADGAEQWREIIDGDAHGFDSADAIAVDGAGNVVAAGSLNQSASWDIVVVLWNVAGVEQWRRYIDGPLEGSFDLAYDVTFDVDGNVVVAGTTGGSEDLVVAKFDPKGNEQWRRAVRGTSPITVQSVAGVRTDSQGNVVVAGGLNNTTTGFDFTVISWNPFGTERWRRSINGSDADANDFASALAIDGQDAVVAVGTTENEGGFQWTAVKWTETGAELWRRILIGDPDLLEATPTDVTTDAAGAVIACGWVYYQKTGYYDLVVIKSASEGPELWRSILDGGAEDEAVQSEAGDGWNAVAVDANGHVLVGGTSIQEGSADDFTVAKLDGATGQLTVCGNGVVEPGEDCDPGSDVPGDCCTSGCGYVADGNACEDGDSDACAAPDVCGSGSCQSGARSCRIDVPADPIDVANVVEIPCQANPGAVWKAVLLEVTPAVTRDGAAAATGPRRLSRKARLRIKSDGDGTLRLQLNRRGRALLRNANGVAVPVVVQATVRDAGATRVLQKAIQLRRR